MVFYLLFKILFFLEIQDEHETNCKKSRSINDAHFFTSQMDNYLVKTECILNFF